MYEATIKQNNKTVSSKCGSILPGMAYLQLCPRAQERGETGGICPLNVSNTECISLNIVAVSGVGSQDFSEFEKIWTVVGS